jgi:hypothetical protein
MMKADVDVVDVREPHEIPAVNEFAHIRIPLAQLADNISLIKSDTVIAFCQSGKEVYRLQRFYLVFLETQRKFIVYEAASCNGNRIGQNKRHERKKTKEHICARAIAASFIADSIKSIAAKLILVGTVFSWDK